eukprot:TCALIF_10457-PA protein Name:"Similar to clasp1 CLIP-associating protein 1 (Xenopus tropicalis)" AED:0.13 eAED:0.13 QI:0/0.69/0.64/0.92/0.69/0.78/14/163/953
MSFEVTVRCEGCVKRYQLGLPLRSNVSPLTHRAVTRRVRGLFVAGIERLVTGSVLERWVCQNGLDIVGLLVERMGHSFRSYLGTVLVPTLDRLGDARESVREKAHNGLKLFMREVVDPQTLFDKLSTGFTHKNAKVREEVLFLVQDTLNEHGAHSLVISKMMHQIVNLASDPAAPVRDAAMTTLVEIYRHVGERVQSDLERKFQLPQAKLAVLLSKFDELRKSGEVVESPPLPDNQRGKDETDLVQSKSLTSKARSSSVPAGVRRPGSFAVPKAPTADTNSNVMTTSSCIRRNSSMRGATAPSSMGAGGLDEDSFTKSFEEVKHVNIFSGRALSEEIAKIKETLSKSSNDWKSRVDALQMVRSLMLAGALNFDEMHNSLRTLDVPFQVSIKDLRSQVVREACITVAYLSQQMGHKVDRLLEILFQNIINLIPNSAKVMSSSGIICIRFIIQNTFSSRFVPIITCNVTSKSRDIRRHCCEFLDLILHSWPTQSLEKHAHLIQEAIKKGIADADPEARQFARNLTNVALPMESRGAPPLLGSQVLAEEFPLSRKEPLGKNSQAERRKPAASFPFEDASDESEVSSVSSIGQSGHSPMKPRHIQSTNSLKGSNYSRPLANNNSRANTHLDPVNDSENLNPEDVHKNLRFTASAIQNYSFDSPGDLSDGSKFNLVNNAAPTLEEKMRMLDSRVSSVEESQSGNSIISTDPTRANLEMEDIMEILQSVKSGTKAAERRTCMTHLIRLTREGTVKQIQDNFRTILRLLLENLLDDVGATRALVYGVLTEMLKHEALSQSFQAFTELIILKVLEAHRDQEKDVERAAEGCAAAMAFILPSDIVIRVLNPIIKTGDFPVNQAAVKMLTKVADHQKSYDSIVANLSDIMPGLLKAYDNVESSVRKAAVFCMVSLHQRVGDELQPHLECLNGSKLKLLNLYIKRAQSQKEQSMPSSPRLQTPM